MKRNKTFLIVFAALLLCGAAGALRVPKGVSSALLALPDGFKVRADLALTPEAQEKGLMFREELPADYGMLFVFSGLDVKSFWMKNTYVDLDMVFLDGKMKVLRVFHRVPRSRKGLPESEVARATAPAACVLELPAGTARAHKLRPGARIKVSFTRPGPAK